MRTFKGLFIASILATTFGLAAGDALGGDESVAIGGDPSTVWFVSPLPNAQFEQAPVTLDVEAEVYQSATDVPIMTVELFLEGESLGSQDCPESCIFTEVEIPQGARELRLESDSGVRAVITVYVDEDLPPVVTEDGDGDVGDDAGDGGCGACTLSDGDPTPWGVLALPVLMLAGLRRKRA